MTHTVGPAVRVASTRDRVSSVQAPILCICHGLMESVTYIAMGCLVSRMQFEGLKQVGFSESCDATTGSRRVCPR